MESFSHPSCLAAFMRPLFNDPRTDMTMYSNRNVWLAPCLRRSAVGERRYQCRDGNRYAGGYVC